jgi:tRNA (cmo5U34)-methyltransferase
MPKNDERIRKIKAHFEKEALVFDKMFFKIMPRYQEMMQAVVDAIPFDKNERLEIIDLGCGTGNLSKKISDVYPYACITCIDMAENMLAAARRKLVKNNHVSFWLGDVRDFNYSDKYDVIVSSMVLHHIEGQEKPKFYHKLYNALKEGGVFYTIDIFLSSNSHLQKLYMDKWKKFMQTNGLDMKKVNDMITRHQREDRPVCFEDELKFMHKAGFKNVDVLLKHYNFMVYGGAKK